MRNILTLGQVPHMAQTLAQYPNFLPVFMKMAGDDKHQLALVLASAMMAFPNAPKPENHPQFSLAKKLLDQLQLEGVNNLQLQKTPDGMCADYDISRPSDEARKQYAEARAREGKTYIGPRAVGVRKARRGVQRLIVSVGQALCQ